MNYQKMWFNLKEYIISKNSHGKNELINKMSEEEIKANTDIFIIKTDKEGNENIALLGGGIK